MMTLRRALLVACATFAIGIGSASIAAAQDPAPAPKPTQPPAPAAEPIDMAKTKTAKGELVKVDVATKTLTIKMADGTESKFLYTDATTITGSTEKAAGLNTVAGSAVTVHFRATDTAEPRTATKIDVEKKKY